MDGLIFGLIDNGGMIIGAMVGFDIGERLGRAKCGAVCGGGSANLITDTAGAVGDPSMHHMIAGIALGCAIPLLLIPLWALIKKYISFEKTL